MAIISVFKQNRDFMLSASSSFVNNKNADAGVQTHDQPTLPLVFSLIEMLSDIFSCYPLLHRFGSRCYISFVCDVKNVICSSECETLNII